MSTSRNPIPPEGGGPARDYLADERTDPAVRVQLEEGMFQTASTGPIVITALALLMSAAAVVFVLV